MTTMDVNGVSWVGGMCQRFEALCVDVDEKIYEDTFIYVGKQMRTVGESVKRLYSEVMQDLLASSSLDPTEEKNVLATLARNGYAAICKKQKQNFDNEHESVDTTFEIAGKSSAEEQCTPETSQSQSADLVSNISSTVEHCVNCGQEQESQQELFSDMASKDFFKKCALSESWNDRDKSSSECRDMNSIKGGSLKVGKSYENAAEISGDVAKEYVSAIAVKGSQTKATTAGDVPTELDNSVSSMKAVVGTTITGNIGDAVEFENAVSDAETSNSRRTHETGTADADKQRCLKLEDSCVLVENDDQFSKPTRENVQKSYKKKIREVFSPRRWSKSKRDQEQLTGRYEEQFGNTSVSTCMMPSEIQKLPTSESLDSEWELL